jgi:hypothetical protein
MFVQVIKGHTSDPEGAQRQGELWQQEVKPGAIGYLGSTAGVAEDGTFIVLARFADEASARANSDRPEQGAWWEEMAKYFDDEPTFRESSDVATMLDGGSDDAGFVQIMEGSVTDRAKAESFETPEMMDQLRQGRPDLIGSLRVWFPDDSFVDAVYFTSEENARKGEASEEFGSMPDEMMEVYGEMTFIDLKDPMLNSA